MLIWACQVARSRRNLVKIDADDDDDDEDVFANSTAPNPCRPLPGLCLPTRQKKVFASNSNCKTQSYQPVGNSWEDDEITGI